MSELRQDRTTGARVIIAPRRGRRPNDTAAPEREPESVPAFDPRCPFCPGHEAELPGIIAETAADKAPGWSVRTVPNKYPALQPTDLAAPVHRGHSALAGYGFHEVVIESPRHNANLATMPPFEREAVVAMYRERSTALLGSAGIEAVVVFRNHGIGSGSSRVHPHAQIIALGLVPPQLAAMIQAGLDHFRKEGRCATCTELQVELELGERIVDQNTRFVALVPYAAEHPFELWLVPRRHQASFTTLTDADLPDFSELLGRSLTRIAAVLPMPSYKFAIDSAPRSEIAAAHFHWRLRIVPETVTWGGFELGSGMPINPSSPEDDAAMLRAVTLQRQSAP